MICPHCHNKIAWPKVFLITLWSSLRCGTCRHQWNRSPDRQGYLLSFVTVLLMMPFLFVIDSKGFLIGLLYLAAVLTFVAFIDAKTIHLVPPAARKTSKLE